MFVGRFLRLEVFLFPGGFQECYRSQEFRGVGGFCAQKEGGIRSKLGIITSIMLLIPLMQFFGISPQSFTIWGSSKVNVQPCRTYLYAL